MTYILHEYSLYVYYLYYTSGTFLVVLVHSEREHVFLKVFFLKVLKGFKVHVCVHTFSINLFRV